MNNLPSDLIGLLSCFLECEDVSQLPLLSRSEFSWTPWMNQIHKTLDQQSCGLLVLLSHKMKDERIDEFLFRQRKNAFDYIEKVWHFRQRKLDVYEPLLQKWIPLDNKWCPFNRWFNWLSSMGLHDSRQYLILNTTHETAKTDMLASYLDKGDINMCNKIMESSEMDLVKDFVQRHYQDTFMYWKVLRHDQKNVKCVIEWMKEKQISGMLPVFYHSLQNMRMLRQIMGDKIVKCKTCGQRYVDFFAEGVFVCRHSP